MDPAVAVRADAKLLHQRGSNRGANKGPISAVSGSVLLSSVLIHIAKLLKMRSFYN
jgi:hypothetical protein